MNKRDMIRLVEEHFEKIRRQKVASGEWKEAESLQQLQKYIEDEEAEAMGPAERKRFIRDCDEFLKEWRELENPESLLEKEYHFDETCGCSL